MNDVTTTRTTEERMQTVLQSRMMFLRAQKELDNLSSRLAPDKAKLDLAIASLQTAFEQEHANELIQKAALEKAIEVSEENIRAAVVEEYESRSASEKKDKAVAPNLGVQVRESRSITEDWTHDAVLGEVREKYPTLITFDEKKLLKQSKVYDVDYYDEFSPADKRGRPYIKEMPYIVIEQKVGAVIKAGFWEEGEKELANESK